ncbi:MAG: 1,4-dihydroxy-2-naphthoate polyprenyltransferase [Chloroflexota bacterium]
MSNKTSVWISAMRLRTLPLAIASIILGSALAAAHGGFRWGVAILAILTAVSLQILSNFANDYGDAVHGADSQKRGGPQRAVQSGQVTRQQMQRAIAIMVVVSCLIGLALLWAAFGNSTTLIIVFILLGISAIIGAITYTAGKRPYGYVGLGDISVLIFFGWVGVMGAYFLHTTTLNWLVMLPATACGLLAVAVLNVNNIRDIESDKAAGKQSIPVRLGRERAVVYHWLLFAGALLTAVLYVILTYTSPWQFLFLLVIPLLVRNGTAVRRITAPMQLNPYLRQMSLTTLAFVLLFSLGQLLASSL